MLDEEGLVEHIVLSKDCVDGALQVGKSGCELPIVGVLAGCGQGERTKKRSLHLNEVHGHQQKSGECVEVVLVSKADRGLGRALGKDVPELEGLDDTGVGGQLHHRRGLALELSLHPLLARLDQGLEARVVERLEVGHGKRNVVLPCILAVHLEELDLPIK